ncbi:MAG TPA: hypothetical protein VJ960_03725, partial [Oceanipulchritudo sp.]|nr:hypothetical protein [Oceanipulchritudo sp.]
GGLGADGRADLENRVQNAISALEAFRLIGFDQCLNRFAEQFHALYGRRLAPGRENTIQSVQSDAALLKRVHGVFEGSLKARIAEMCADDAALYEAALEKLSN